MSFSHHETIKKKEKKLSFFLLYEQQESRVSDGRFIGVGVVFGASSTVETTQE